MYVPSHSKHLFVLSPMFLFACFSKNNNKNNNNLMVRKENSPKDPELYTIKAI